MRRLFVVSTTRPDGSVPTVLIVTFVDVPVAMLWALVRFPRATNGRLTPATFDQPVPSHKRTADSRAHITRVCWPSIVTPVPASIVTSRVKALAIRTMTSLPDWPVGLGSVTV